MKRFAEVVSGFNTPIGKRRWILVLVLVLGCAAVGFAVRAYSKRAPGPSAVTERPTLVGEDRSSSLPTGAQSGPPTERVETAVVTLQPSGFDLREIVRDEGRMILIVVNRTGLEEISLNLDRQSGARLRAARVGRNKPRWGDIFDLTPGQYVLSEENHPEWACRITVKAK